MRITLSHSLLCSISLFNNEATKRVFSATTYRVFLFKRLRLVYHLFANWRLMPRILYVSPNDVLETKPRLNCFLLSSKSEFDDRKESPAGDHQREVKTSDHRKTTSQPRTWWKIENRKINLLEQNQEAIPLERLFGRFHGLQDDRFNFPMPIFVCPSSLHHRSNR